MRYLLHLDKSGAPVGIHSETKSVYFPMHATAEKYGTAVVRSRGSETSWDEWCEQLSEQALSLRARWLPFTSPVEDMEALLLNTQNSAQYEIA